MTEWMLVHPASAVTGENMLYNTRSLSAIARRALYASYTGHGYYLRTLHSEFTIVRLLFQTVLNRRSTGQEYV